MDNCDGFKPQGNYYLANYFGNVHILRSVSGKIRNIDQSVKSPWIYFPLFSPLGITFPSGEGQHSLLSALYERSGVDPSGVSYVEAHGTGTKVGDPQEVNNIAKIFCENREGPLLLGSVKSNIGHTEATAGSIIRLCRVYAYHCYMCLMC